MGMGREGEVAYRPGAWVLEPARIMLAKSPNLGWEGLRSILREWPSIDVVAEVTRAEQAVATAGRHHPDGVLTAVDLEGTSIVTLAEQLREVSPDSRIIVFTDELDHKLQAVLKATNVYGVLLWKGVTSKGIYWCLGTVLEAGQRVASPAVVEELVAPSEQRGSGGVQTMELSGEEQTVLTGLAADLSESEIAEQEPMSRATVGRIVARLKRKLGVRTLVALGARARDQGFGDRPE
jgi:DNA-binding NarL/FixJ family response regulator